MFVVAQILERFLLSLKYVPSINFLASCLSMKSATHVLDKFFLFPSFSLIRVFLNLFEHIELPAKLLDYFLRSNKSNINQCPSILVPYRRAVTILEWIGWELTSTRRLCLQICFQDPVTRSRCLCTSSSADSSLIAFSTTLFHIDFWSSYLTLPSFRQGFCHVKTARFVMGRQRRQKKSRSQTRRRRRRSIIDGKCIPVGKASELIEDKPIWFTTKSNVV